MGYDPPLSYSKVMKIQGDRLKRVYFMINHNNKNNNKKLNGDHYLTSRLPPQVKRHSLGNKLGICFL